MATGKVEICGIDTSTLPVIRGEAAREMLARAQNGDEQARQAFIQGNLRLVLSVIQRFQGRGESVDDLFQVGCIGLIKAIDHFDLGQNVRFSTYAVPIIARCRKTALGEQGSGAALLIGSGGLVQVDLDAAALIGLGVYLHGPRRVELGGVGHAGHRVLGPGGHVVG